MENNENLVTEQVAENVEQTTEETMEQIPEQGQEQAQEQIQERPPKTYTQEEVDAIVGRRNARTEAKVRKEFERKYGGLHAVLSAGTGEQDVEKITESLRSYYGGRGIQMPEQPKYSDKDAAVLASADAADIIQGGYDEVVEEVDRLMAVGYANMTAREKAEFKILAEYRQKAERIQELAKIGVTEDEYGSKEFQEFAAQFNIDTPITKVYEYFQQMKPKKTIKTMGSMKQGKGPAVKDFYTPEEIEKLTEEDLDDPKVWEAVRRSMTGR